MSNKALTTAIKDSGNNVNEQAAAIVAALNNENNNLAGTDDMNLGDAGEAVVAAEGGGVWRCLGGWCNCGAPVRCVSMYYLTLNVFLLIIVSIYKPDMNPALTWWAAFLVAVLVNIIASAALLYMTFRDVSTDRGPDLEMGQVPPSASDDPKSESFKTILTINSKAATGKTFPVVVENPAIKVSSSTASNIGKTGSDEPANSQASTGFTNMTPESAKHTSKERKAKDKRKEGKDKKKDKKKHKKKAGSKEKDKEKDKEKEAQEEDTNFGLIPSNVLGAQKEVKAKKKKGNKHKKKKVRNQSHY